MSFSSSAKEDLVKIRLKTREQRLAQLAGLVHTCGALTIGRGRGAVWQPAHGVAVWRPSRTNAVVACCGGRNPDYREEDGQRVMNKPEILVRVVLNSGAAQATVWTCDFSYDYVRINADYRS